MKNRQHRIEDQCCLCGTRHLLTFHHLIPRSCHRNKWFRKHFTLADMKERGITLCRKCHSFIHRQHSEKTLGRHYNTLAALLADETISTYAAWAARRVSDRDQLS
ncbi:MAG: hypothetical protein KDI36_06345 [Pseudomonadales bacterium]|nr:hypothetical protein [Pseudomonadales bacterium]